MKVSIIIPIYNVERYIKQCLDSCLSQTYSDIEILAIDDGSNDNSGKILDLYAINEPRLRVFHQLNQGVVAARNVGIKNADGDWIMFVDSDDFLEVDAVKVLLNEAVSTSVLVVVATFRSVNESNQTISVTKIANTSSSDNLEIAQWLLMEKIPFSLWAKIFHRSLFDDIYADTSLKIGEDAYVTIQLLHNANKVVLMNRVVYNYLQRANSVTHTPSNIAIYSIIDFISATIHYYKSKSYLNNPQFLHSLNYFIMKEYFSYLRMGGGYVVSEIRDHINTHCLSDRVACNMTPVWRILLLWSYRVNILLGRLVRVVIVLMRKIRA